METVTGDNRGEWAPYWAVVKELEWLIEDLRKSGGETNKLEVAMATLQALQPVANIALDRLQKFSAKGECLSMAGLMDAIGASKSTIKRAISRLKRLKMTFPSGGHGKKVLFTPEQCRAIAIYANSDLPFPKGW